MKNKNLSYGINDLEARTLEQPDDGRIYYRLGHLYECRFNDDAKANQFYLKHLLYTLGHNDADAAIADIRELMAADDHDPVLHIQLGEIYGYQGRLADSESEMKKGTIWTTIDSEHYALSMVPGSTAYRELDNIIKHREKAFSMIRDEFQLDLEGAGRIKYFFYESRLHKGTLTGDRLPAHAWVEKGEVHAVYNDVFKNDSPHEDAHIVLGRLGRPPKLIEEGAAEFFWQRKTVHAMYLDAVNGNVAGGVSKLIDDGAFAASDHHVAYPLAASFVAFLVERHGIAAFKRLYRLSAKEAQGAVKRIYGVGLQELEEQWRRYLNGQTL